MFNVESQADLDDQAALLILDAATLAVLDSCTTTSDLVSHGIVGVQKIYDSREPLPQYPAIYFVEPTVENMELIIHDFVDTPSGKPHYKRAFIFVNNPLGREAMNTLKAASGLRAHIAALTELPASYKAVYGPFFTAGEKDHLRTVLLKADDDEVKDIDADDVDSSEEIDKIASDILSLCSQFGSVPYVRYQRESSPAAKKLAEAVTRKAGPRSSKGSSDLRTTVIILDRSYDPIAPLVHDLTLEPACADVQSIEWKSGGSMTIVPEALQPNEKPAKKYHFRFPDADNDPNQLWNRFRYTFLYHEEIKTSYSKALRRLKETNAAAQYLTMNDKDKASTSLMSSVIQQMQAYNETAQALNSFFHAFENSIAKAEQFQLARVADITQSMATMKDYLGKSFSLERLSEILSNEKDNFTPFDLLRILLVAHAMQLDKKPLSASDRARIMRIPVAVEPAFEQLSVLINMQPNSKWQPNSARVEAGQAFAQENKAMNGGVRFVPRIWELLQALKSNTLDESAFPYVSDKSSKSRVFFVYMLGGYTYSEMRIVATYGAEMNVYLGGSAPITARDYIMQLAGIKSEAQWRATGLSKYGITNLPDCPGVTEARRAMADKAGTIVAEEEVKLDTGARKDKKDKKEKKEKKKDKREKKYRYEDEDDEDYE